jgi:glycosyltransferase involved in cell wall biosynthesis
MDAEHLAGDRRFRIDIMNAQRLRLKKIGLNVLYLVPGRVGGVEIYARELIRALALEAPDTEFVVFCGLEASDSLAGAGWPANVRIVTVRSPSAIKPLRILVEMLALPLLARRERVELLHSLGTTAPLWSACPRFVTVHDLIFHHFPSTFPRLARLALEMIVPLAARRSLRVHAISHATKNDLVATYGVPAKQIDVIYLGVGMSSPDLVAGEADLRRRFELGTGRIVLCVAAAFVHKNIPRLLEAFRDLRGRVPAGTEGPVLVVVGHAGRDHEILQARTRELGIASAVRFTGWIAASDLEGMYRIAGCFAYPSLFEGFGMPVLEAMRRGTPVASSNATSLAEVAGDGAVLFDPRDTVAMSRAIEALLYDENLRREQIRRGYAQAGKFAWRNTAQQTLDSYLNALAPC